MATDIPPEAIGFLSAAGVFLVLLVVLFLFINKKLSFETTGGLPCLEQRGKRKHSKDKTGIYKGPVNSFGDDEELSTSSDSDEEVIKQFEISVSRSQSFRSGASEKGKQTGLEHKPKPSHCLSTHKEDSTEVSTCKGLDGASQLTYSENLSYGEDDPISAHSQSPCELGDTRHHGVSPGETSVVHSLSRQSTEGSLEMETAFNNRGFEDSYATDSSSVWSPEEQDGTNFQVPPGVPEPISKCGDLDVIFEYRAASQKLTVTIVRAQGLPDKDRSGVNSWQVHVVLLPSKKQRGRTSIQRGSNPIFKEKVTFAKLEPRDVAACAVRFRLYAALKMTRERMMGERLFYLSHLHQDGEMKVTLVLEPRSNISSGESPLSPSAVSHSDSASSTQSLSHGGAPELLVGLSYNATTGRLSVEMIKGSHFRNLAVNRAPDTYGKLFLFNSVGQEMSRCKTSIRRGQPNPVYKETFVFQVALFQLSDVTLMISVYNRRTMKRKEMIGWIALGQNSSGEEERDHWEEMKETKGQQIDSALPAYPTKVLTYTLTTSKVAYFKRKYAEEEDLHQDYHGYFPKHLILPEDRTCILKLSLEKLRFLEDPETYLRRSVLINNLLRKIHLETEKESYEYFKEAPCYKTAYSDTRKRLKFMVQECCSQSLYYEELHSYHIVPYASENAIYGMGYTSSHLEQNSQLLIYKMN
ncbi:hypothetical protein CapIbe_008906 [Capra ibex]